MRIRAQQSSSGTGAKGSERDGGIAWHDLGAFIRYEQLHGTPKRRHRRTIDNTLRQSVALNILQREFTAARPNERWAADITYLRMGAGWLYLAVVLSLYARAVIGWAMKSHLTCDLVLDAVTMALWRRGSPTGLVHHSNRGSRQYASEGFGALFETTGIQCSMSRTGNCYGKTVVESFCATVEAGVGY